MRGLLLAFCLLLLLGTGETFGQTQQTIAPSLNVDGEVAHPLKLSAADMAKLPRQTVSAKDHDGKTAVFEGVALVEILKIAGVEFGRKVAGQEPRLVSGSRCFRWIPGRLFLARNRSGVH